MDRKLDVLFVNPDSSFRVYQGLSKRHTAIEPPTWALLLAESCRAEGYGVGILDCAAERLSLEDSVKRIVETNPRMVCFVLYGQNPNSGTVSMVGAELLGEQLKREFPELCVCIVGSHASALPIDVLALPFVDIVLLNEGVYALRHILQTDITDSSLKKVNGIGYKKDGALILNPPERVVPQELMDRDLPGYAWDLLPYREKPLDLYRSSVWHGDFNEDFRTPYAAIYTALGCPFKCGFCMINIVNRIDNGTQISAQDSAIMRSWSPGFVLRQFESLAMLGVETVRLSDEMFFLNKRHYEPILKGIIERGIKLRSWAYARVDTVQSSRLELFRQSGIGWLALGIEAGNQSVRTEVSKGSFKDINIGEVVQTVRDSGINVIANYMFGLPNDSFKTMEETLRLALLLNTEMANMYPCQALPGSPLYHRAQREGLLPKTYAGFGFLSYDSVPLPTEYCTSAEVLAFRDLAWGRYFSDQNYLALVERKFGITERRNVEEMTQIPLRRGLLGHSRPEE